MGSTPVPGASFYGSPKLVTAAGATPGMSDSWTEVKGSRLSDTESSTSASGRAYRYHKSLYFLIPIPKLINRRIRNQTTQPYDSEVDKSTHSES